MSELNYKMLDELPRDLKREIQKYLVTTQMYLTSKKNWKKYIKIRVSSIIMSDLGLINYNTYNTYIRYLIRNKSDYVFKYVVKESKTKEITSFISNNRSIGKEDVEEEWDTIDCDSNILRLRHKVKGIEFEITDSDIIGDHSLTKQEKITKQVSRQLNKKAKS